MAEVLLFHHAHGLTNGVRDFAETIRRDGHTVHTPDLYEGRVFDDLEEGVAHADEIGFGTILERGRAAAEGLPPGLFYAGFSLGVLPAQMLAQTRGGAKGALLFHSCVPTAELFVYPGDQHLFADPTLPSYDKDADRLLRERVLGFLAAVA